MKKEVFSKSFSKTSLDPLHLMVHGMCFMEYTDYNKLMKHIGKVAAGKAEYVVVPVCLPSLEE